MQHKANYNTVTVTYLNSFVAEDLYFQTYPEREREREGFLVENRNASLFQISFNKYAQRALNFQT